MELGFCMFIRTQLSSLPVTRLIRRHRMSTRMQMSNMNHPLWSFPLYANSFRQTHYHHFNQADRENYCHQSWAIHLPVDTHHYHPYSVGRSYRGPGNLPWVKMRAKASTKEQSQKTSLPRSFHGG